MPDGNPAELLQPEPADFDTSGRTVRRPPDRPGRLPRQDGLFAMVPMARIMDRRHDTIYGSRLRLLALLEIRSRRGQRLVRLTNEMAAEIGLDRAQKSRCLSYLAAHGFITVEQVGQRAPVIEVLSL